jgi:hypothetical protein
LEEGTYAVPLGDSADERQREITTQEIGSSEEIVGGIGFGQLAK